MTAKHNYRTIPADLLHPNPDNPRREAGDVTDLARSLSATGQLQPALVRVRFGCLEHTQECYYIEAGYRRWVALKALDLPVECQVRYPAADETPRTRNIVVGLVENLHREGLNPIEVARGLGALRDSGNYTQAQLAELTGLHPTSVNRFLAYLDLAPKTQEAVRTGNLGSEVALNLVRNAREKQRKKSGKKSLNVEWEPEYLTKTHMLASIARTMCDARNHTQRRRIGGIACGQCWETAIRQDQDVVVQAKYAQLGHQLPETTSWPVDHPMSAVPPKFQDSAAFIERT